MAVIRSVWLTVHSIGQYQCLLRSLDVRKIGISISMVEAVTITLTKSVLGLPKRHLNWPIQQQECASSKEVGNGR